MKVIEQLIQHFRAEGSLSERDLEHLTRKGFLLVRPEEEDWFPPERDAPEGPFDGAEEELAASPSKKQRRRNRSGRRACIRRWWATHVHRVQRRRQGR
jgi:hypothetical protein